MLKVLCFEEPTLKNGKIKQIRQPEQFTHEELKKTNIIRRRLFFNNIVVIEKSISSIDDELSKTILLYKYGKFTRLTDKEIRHILQLKHMTYYRRLNKAIEEFSKRIEVKQWIKLN